MPQAANLELREPAPPEALLPADSASALWWTLVVVLLAAAALAVVWRLRKRRPAAPDVATLRAEAYQQALAALTALDTTVQARAVATQASLILRRYLATALSDPSLYETHEEFVARSDSLKPLTDSARAACHQGLADLAAVKYAPADAAVAPATLLAGARELLETLHHGFTR